MRRHIHHRILRNVRVLRRERPYAVLTEVGFPRIDTMVQRVFEELQVPGTVALSWRGNEAELSVTLDLSRLEAAETGDDTPVAHLIDDLARYEIVLTDGRFVSAGGFELLENNTRATLTQAAPQPGRVELRLAWIHE